jgi:hypothetical protein
MMITAAHAEERKPLPVPVVIPSEFRGSWCPSAWNTIYRRCQGASDFMIDRDTVTTVEETKYTNGFPQGERQIERRIHSAARLRER